jgi:hypothetical protein
VPAQSGTAEESRCYYWGTYSTTTGESQAKNTVAGDPSARSAQDLHPGRMLTSGRRRARATALRVKWGCAHGPRRLISTQVSCRWVEARGFPRRCVGARPPWRAAPPGARGLISTWICPSWVGAGGTRPPGSRPGAGQYVTGPETASIRQCRNMPLPGSISTHFLRPG